MHLDSPRENPAPARRGGPATWLTGRVAFWAGFALVHGVLIYLGLGKLHDSTFWDVEIYRGWVQFGFEHGSWPVFGYAWVYPILGFAPMLFAYLLSGGGATAYLLAWCAQVVALNALAAGVVLRRSRRVGRAGTLPAWFLIAFLAALGTVSIGRIDAIAAPLATISLVAMTRTPAAASVIATLAAWIKIFPAGVILAALATTRRWFVRVLLPALVVSGVIAAVVVAGGGGAHLLSFLTAQSGRGLQIEAVIATPDVLVRALQGQPVGVYNPDLNTVEVPGSASQSIAAASTFVLIALAALTFAFVWRARRDPRALAIGTFALTLALIVANKVGSPQFACALAPAITVALISWHREHGVKVLALGLLASAALTQIVFPWTYNQLLAGQLGPVVILSVRNLAYAGLLAYALRLLARLASPTALASAAQTASVSD